MITVPTSQTVKCESLTKISKIVTQPGYFTEKGKQNEIFK